MLVMSVAWYRGLAALAKTDPSPCSPTAMIIFLPALWAASTAGGM